MKGCIERRNLKTSFYSARSESRPTVEHIAAIIITLLGVWIRGGDLEGTGGMVPKNWRWGDGPCIRPPNNLRSSVVGCSRKYEQSLKRCHKGILFWNSGYPVVFLVRKGSYTTFNVVKIRKIREKKLKIRKTWSLTKKKVIRNFGRENGNFFWRNRHSEILVHENFVHPPNSATGLRHWSECTEYHMSPLTFCRTRTILKFILTLAQQKFAESLNRGRRAFAKLWTSDFPNEDKHLELINRIVF